MKIIYVFTNVYPSMKVYGLVEYMDPESDSKLQINKIKIKLRSTVCLIRLLDGLSMPNKMNFTDVIGHIKNNDYWLL